MDKKIFFKAIPFDKELVTLALESGVDGIIVEEAKVEDVKKLGRIQVVAENEFKFIQITNKQDEEKVVEQAKAGQTVILGQDTEIIPIENILAQTENVGQEVSSLEEAKTALGILEKGVSILVVLANGANQLKEIVKAAKLSQGDLELTLAEITNIQPIGLGHRVCVDTTSILKTGQGMLVGNSSRFTFLVHAETEVNPYVAPRPFRINAGAVHSYTFLPGDKTAYLEELKPGTEILIVNENGQTELAVVGRIKTEIRPLLLVEAKVEDVQGKVIIQNAETIRLVGEKGPVSVVQLQPGDKVKVRLDQAGRHFGMRIQENIIEA